MIKPTRRRPTVTITLNDSIQRLVGEYTAETEKLIWTIADNQRAICSGCRSQNELDTSLQNFIKTL